MMAVSKPLQGSTLHRTNYQEGIKLSLFVLPSPYLMCYLGMWEILGLQGPNGPFGRSVLGEEG